MRERMTSRPASPRARKYGTTWSCIMPFISRGTPGVKIRVLSRCSMMTPGALPRLFRIMRAPRGSMACFSC
jgi:hypothetical protein